MSFYINMEFNQININLKFNQISSFDLIKGYGGSTAQVGEIRNWGGNNYQKQSDGKWQYVKSNYNSLLEKLPSLEKIFDKYFTYQSTIHLTKYLSQDEKEKILKEYNELESQIANHIYQNNFPASMMNKEDYEKSIKFIKNIPKLSPFKIGDNFDSSLFGEVTILDYMHKKMYKNSQHFMDINYHISYKTDKGEFRTRWVTEDQLFSNLRTPEKKAEFELYLANTAKNIGPLIERYAIIGKDNQVMRVCTGGERQCALDSYSMSLLKEGHSLTHNHPSSSAFSDKDLFISLNNNCEMRAVAPESARGPVTFVFKPSRALNKEELKSFANYYSKINEEIGYKYQDIWNKYYDEYKEIAIENESAIAQYKNAEDYATTKIMQNEHKERYIEVLTTISEQIKQNLYLPDFSFDFYWEPLTI